MFLANTSKSTYMQNFFYMQSLNINTEQSCTTGNQILYACQWFSHLYRTMEGAKSQRCISNSWFWTIVLHQCTFVCMHHLLYWPSQLTHAYLNDEITHKKWREFPPLTFKSSSIKYFSSKYADWKSFDTIIDAVQIKQIIILINITWFFFSAMYVFSSWLK